MYTIIIVSALLTVSSSSKSGPLQYDAGGRCCPVCTAGYHVLRHCDERVTSCGPCTGSTFTDRPNGLTDCKPCSVCDQALGLKTVKKCTPSSDTVCGVLEGHYCIDACIDEGGCRAAHQHTTCTPGQFIKHPGTESTDTVCEDCGDGYYSDGSLTSCKPHTDCTSEGLLKIGSKCVEKAVLIWTVLPAVLVLGVVACFCIRKQREKCLIGKDVFFSAQKYW